MIKILFVVLVLVLAIGFVATREEKEATVVSVSETFSEAVSVSDSIQETKETNTQETDEDTKPPVSNGKTLDLSNQGLEKVPDYVFAETGIEALDVSGNNLSGALQAEVRHLQNLKVLDLSNNKFTGVPAEIGQLKNLEVLNLSNNQLTGLPYELGNLSNLKVLNLKGNAYASADLEIIKQGLSSSVSIVID